MPDIPELRLHTPRDQAGPSVAGPHRAGCEAAQTTSLQDLTEDCIALVASKLPLIDLLNVGSTSHTLQAATKQALQTKIDEKASNIATEVNELFRAANPHALKQFLRIDKHPIDVLPEYVQHKVYRKLLTQRRDDSLLRADADSHIEHDFRGRIDRLLSHPAKLAALSSTLRNLYIDHPLPLKVSAASPDAFLISLQEYLERGRGH